MVLPDLVSNIEYASDVTPLGSPEGVTPDALTCHTPRQDPGGEPKKVRVSGVGVGDSKDKRDTCAKNEEQTLTQQTTRELTTGTEEVRPGAQRLQRSIADDALTIYKKYLAKDAESPVGMDEGIVEDVGRRISAVEQDIDPDCFLLAQEAVVATLEKE